MLSESLSLSALGAAVHRRHPVGGAPDDPAQRRGDRVALVFAAIRDTQIWVVALVAVAFGAYALLARCSAVDVQERVAGADRRHRAGRWSSCAPRPLHGVSPRPSRTCRTAARGARASPTRTASAGSPSTACPRRLDSPRLARATSGVDGNAPVVAIDLADPAFQPLARWLRTDAARTYVAWLALHPGTVLEGSARATRTYLQQRRRSPLLLRRGRPSRRAAAHHAAVPRLAVGRSPAAVVARRRRRGSSVSGAARPGRPWRCSARSGSRTCSSRGTATAWRSPATPSVGNVQVRLGVLILLLMLLDGRRERAARIEPRAGRRPISRRPRSARGRRRGGGTAPRRGRSRCW